MVSFNEYFDTKLSDLPSVDNVVTISSDASILEACMTLHDANILSAPVFDVNAEPDARWLSKYLGMVDMMQIAAFVVRESGGSSNTKLFNFLEKMKDMPVFSSTKVTEIVVRARTANLIALPTENSLLDALLILGKFQVHRIPLIDSLKGDIVNIVSQSSAVREMVKILTSDRLTNLRSELSALEISYNDKVVSVKDTDPLMSAFATMAEEGVSAVPVLDSQTGRLIANISASDIHYIVSQPLLFASATVNDSSIKLFLEWYVENHAQQRTPVTVHPISWSTTENDGGKARMEDVVKQLVDRKVHRVYVTSDGRHGEEHEGKLLGVISLCDVINAVTVEPQDYFDDFFSVNSPEYRT